MLQIITFLDKSKCVTTHVRVDKTSKTDQIELDENQAMRHSSSSNVIHQLILTEKRHWFPQMRMRPTQDEKFSEKKSISIPSEKVEKRNYGEFFCQRFIAKQKEFGFFKLYQDVCG